MKVFWTKGTVKGVEPRDLSEDPEYSQRLQYLGDKQQNCTVRLSHVTLKDSHMYYFSFITDKPDGKWTGDPGVTLTVTDLQVESPERVTEGDSVNLRCKSSCALTDRATFIWYRNSQPLTERRDRNNELLLQSVRREDSGRYSCAVDGHTHISPAVQLNVMLVSSDGWRVSYSPSHICALKDSTVIMRCTYKYPTGYQIMKVFWTESLKGVEPPDLSNDTEYSQRLQYLGDKQQNCTVRLSHVTLKDSHMYYFKFITDKTGGKYTGAPGVTLTVTDLQVESPERVTEGDSVNLRCKSSCALTDRATFIWYRNSQPLTERRDRNNELLLQSVRREDSGRYSCAVDGHTHISPDVQLNVMYPPQSVSVSVSPSGVIVEGDSVTLNCISDSNPPALNFSWFKENETSAVGSGQSFSISSFNSSFSGRFYCEAQNKHGSQRSASVSLTVKGVQRDALVTVSGIVAGCGGFIFIIVIIIIEDHIDRSAETASTNDDPLYSLVSANQRDDLYSNIKAKKQTETDSADVEEVQYASVHHFKNKDMKTEEYDCIETHHPSEANRAVMVPVVVSARMTLLLSPIFLLLTSGVFGEDWNVIYETKSICALKGSSVNMSCTYRFPQDHKLTDTFWIKIPDVEIKSLKEYPEYKDRVEYIEDRQNKTAVLRLHNVTENDEKEYIFRVVTATDKKKWIGKPGIRLHVSGLQVQAPQLVLEKETLNLTCRTTCNLTDRFIWYKNGQALKFTSDILQFQSVRSDSGRYSCAVRGHEHLPSPAVSISVVCE
ncbi:unnamed protein product [Leuciscus chuanchicus]